MTVCKERISLKEYWKTRFTIKLLMDFAAKKNLLYLSVVHSVRCTVMYFSAVSPGFSSFDSVGVSDHCIVSYL